MNSHSFVCSLALVGLLAACGDDTAGSGGAGGGAGGGGATPPTPPTTTTTTTTATTTTSSSSGGGEGGGTTTASSSSGTGGEGGSGTGGGAAAAEAICTDIALPPDNAGEGTCVEIDDVTVLCNPVTGEGCAEGEACDIGIDEDGALSYLCYPAPGSAAVCEFCNEVDTFCEAGTSCTYFFFPQSVPADLEQQCAKFCCEDSECGDGVCQPLDPSYGLPGGLCLSRLLE